MNYMLRLKHLSYLTFMVFLVLDEPRIACERSTFAGFSLAVAAFEVAAGLITFFFLELFFFFFFLGASSAAGKNGS